MTYVASGLLGRQAALARLTDKLNLRGSDTLYLLGNVLGGAGSISLLRHLACQENVFPVLGRNDYVASRILGALAEAASADAEELLTAVELRLLEWWKPLGGAAVLEEFFALGADARDDVLDYLAEFFLYDELSVAGQDYVLVHAGLHQFAPERSLEDYQIEDLVLYPADYRKRYFRDKTLVTAAVPCDRINPACTGGVWRGKGHIAVNWESQGRLAAVRLDDGETFSTVC
ncbi:MAG: hypothetical protein LBJ11_09485 [Oscillospiraceae bacterium]|jgi:serine/threonine protein phosphatase 1|nr:hypothetical protein [Oscillospiraceae bacterium]